LSASSAEIKEREMVDKELHATRRTMLGAATLVGVTALGGFATPAVAQTGGKTFVLVHGAWGGGWVWRRVTDRLTAKGYKVFTPTMTGLGERSHLLDAKINLATHITDIVNVIKWEGLTDIVLVGHSYGGFVITGVAEQMQPTISSIVFLDAFMPENGQAVVDTQPTLAAPIAAAAQNGDLGIKPFTFRVNENDRAWLDALHTPQPLATLTQKAIVTGARDRISTKTYIRAKGFPNSQVSNSPFDKYEAQVANTAGWHVHELPCGHFVMLDMPDELTALLVAAA
jgi:pimeloyl-ACP methyl ester carboxylesterase